MASRGGPSVDGLGPGSDGMDFVHRQKVASQYQLSATNKNRLKTCLFFHILLFCLMLLKMSPLLLDRLDVFILEIEELEVPKPLLWEYWWLFSMVITFIGLTSIRRNNAQSMQIYLGGIIANGVIPVLVGLTYYFSDFWTYLNTRSLDKVQTWQGLPYALLWYGFLLAALQVHLFSIYFASNLVSAWRLKGTGAPKKVD